MPKSALVQRYEAVDTSRESKQRAFKTVDESFARLRASGHEDNIQQVLGAISSFKQSRAGLFGGASDKTQATALEHVRSCVEEACTAAGRADQDAVNGLFGALLVLAKNAGGSAKIPQALQAIFVRYAAPVGKKSKNDELAFARNNLGGARGGAYLNPAPAAGKGNAKGAPARDQGPTYTEVTASQDITAKYLSGRYSGPSEAGDQQRFRLHRHQGAIYALDSEHPLAPPLRLWTSGKDRPGKPSREQILLSEKYPAGLGSTAHVFIRDYNPEKLTKKLVTVTGKEWFLDKKGRFLEFNVSMLEMAFACAELGISDHFAFGLWQLEKSLGDEEGLFYMPVVNGEALNKSVGRAASALQYEEFAIALCKLNFAGFYHPDILDWPRPAYQNLILTKNGTPRLTAIDIDQNVLIEKCSKHNEYDYHVADQWLWFYIAVTNGDRSLHDRAYPQGLSPVSHKSGLWLGALGGAPRLKEVALACIEQAKVKPLIEEE